MKHLPYSLLFIFMCFCPLQAQVAKTFYVPKAGSLVELMTIEEANSITHLTLTGKINAIDFRHLRDEFNSLQSLDISNAEISIFAGKNGTVDRMTAYTPNCIPPYAFCKLENGVFKGKESLQQVIISEKIRTIEEAAFKGCTNLKALKINKKTAPNLKKEAIADSLTVIFVPIGCASAYRNAKNWTTYGIVEGEPTIADLTIPADGSLSDELTKHSLRPKDIHFLTVKGKMDESDFKLLRDYMLNLVSVDLSQCTSTVIPDYTFTQKRYLLSVSLPKRLTTIGQRAFSGCSRLSGTVILPPTVTTLGFGAFLGCDKLHTVVATGGQIISVGENLFGDSGGRLIYKDRAN